MQTKRKTIEVKDVISDVAREKLETKDRITKFSIAFGYLIIATTKQCYIFRFLRLRNSRSARRIGIPRSWLS